MSGKPIQRHRGRAEHHLSAPARCGSENGLGRRLAQINRRVRRNSSKRRGVEISQQYLVVNGTGQRLKINYWCCSSSRVSSTSAACMVGLVNSMSITVIVITVNYSELQGGEICDLCCRLGPPCYTRTRHRAPGRNQYRRAARARRRTTDASPSQISTAP